MTVQAVMNESVIEPQKTPLIQKVLVMLGMVSLMGGTITGTMTYLNLGFTETFFADWATNFFTALVTVIPMGFTLMALTSAYHNVGLSNRADFIEAWMNGVLGALPVALVLMTTVSMTIKPKVEKFLKS